MAHVAKVTHRPRLDGSVGISWRAVWTGGDGRRQSKNFSRRTEARAWLMEIAAGRAGGSASMSVDRLAEAHVAYVDALVKLGKRAAVTRDGYHRVRMRYLARDPDFARMRLCDLTSPKCQAWLDDLFLVTGSSDLAGRARRALVSWCRFGMRKGWLSFNPAQPCVVERDGRARDGGPSVILPRKDVLARLLRAAGEGEHSERDTAIVRMLMFGGFRISEVLGMAYDAVSGRPRGVTARVRERLDRHYRTLDAPKTAAGRRDVPLGEATGLAIKAWRLKRGPALAFSHVNGAYKAVRAAGRLFPDPQSGRGVWGYNRFYGDCWLPLMRRAELVEMLPDGKDKRRPVLAFGPHALRHVAVSSWISLGATPKKIQTLIGHATLQITMDTYGHLWNDDEADSDLAQASERLLG